MRLLSLVLLLFFLHFENSSATASTTQSSIQKNEQDIPSTLKVSPLSNQDNFIIYYAFADKKLEPLLKKTMISSFQKIGSVYRPGEDKYKTDGIIIYVIVTPLIEKFSDLASDYKELPVFELSLKVMARVEVLSNGSQIPGIIWEKVQFIGAASKKKKFAQTAVKTLNSILDAFIIDYHKANPAKNGKSPQFFLYAD